MGEGTGPCPSGELGTKGSPGEEFTVCTAHQVESPKGSCCLQCAINSNHMRSEALFKLVDQWAQYHQSQATTSPNSFNKGAASVMKAFAAKLREQ